MNRIYDSLYQKYKDMPLREGHKWVLMLNEDSDALSTVICTEKFFTFCRIVSRWAINDYFEGKSVYCIDIVSALNIQEFIPPTIKQVNGGFKPGEMSVIASGTQGKSNFAIEPKEFNYIEFHKEITKMSFGVHLIKCPILYIPSDCINLKFENGKVIHINPFNIIALSNIDKDEFYIYFKETSILYYHEDKEVLENIHKEIKQTLGF